METGSGESVLGHTGMRTLLYILIGLGISRPAMVEAQDLPAWFFQTPESSDALFAVGYARTYAHMDSAVAMAVRDAGHQINLAKGTKIYGERLFQTLPGGRIVYQGEFFREEPAQTLNPVFIDTVRTDDMVLVLAADRQPDKAVISQLTAPARTPPSWVTELPDSASCMHAVGIAPVYYYEENSWLEAERHARQELAYTFQTRQRQLKRSNSVSEIGVTASATAVFLRDIQIVARWKSATTFFVLVKSRAAPWPDGRDEFSRDTP